MCLCDIQVLPTVLSHPTVSLVSVVVRDPEYFHSPEVTRRVPRLEELRLFTAGSDSGDIVERCLLTGRILVSRSENLFKGEQRSWTSFIANICCSWSSYLGNDCFTNTGQACRCKQQSSHSLPEYIPSFTISRTVLTSHANRSYTRKNEDIINCLGTAIKSPSAKRWTHRERWQTVDMEKPLPCDRKFRLKPAEVERIEREDDRPNGSQQVEARPG